MIKERSSARAIVERPAERVLYQAGLVRFGAHLPQLLEPDPVLLWLAPLLEAEFGHQLFRQRSSRPFGDDRVLALELHAAGEAVGRLSVLADPHVARGDAGYGTLRVVEHLGGGEARVDFDAHLGRLLAQPATEVAEANDVVAVVAHQRRHDEIGDAQGARGAQIVEAVLGDGRLDRRALGFPIGEERGEADRVDDSARQDVRSDLGSLFQHDHGELPAGLGGELLQANRGGKTGRAGPHDHHVEVHRLPRR